MCAVLFSVTKSFIDLFAIKSSDEFVSSIRHPDSRPFSINAVVRKNLLQDFKLLSSARLFKEADRDGYQRMGTQRGEGRGAEVDNVYLTVWMCLHVSVW